MFNSWTVLFAGLAYVGGLFAVASFGDRKARGRAPGSPRPLIYALSLGDFIAARYGKNEMLGALIALIAAVGIIPYISIQLKAVSFALETMMVTPGWSTTGITPLPISEDIAFFVTVAMAAFAMLFGTRHIHTTEHQHG